MSLFKLAKTHSVGFLDTQKAVYNALKRGDEGIDRFLVDRDVVKEKLKTGIKAYLKGNLIGGVSGASLGALLALLTKQKGYAKTLALVGAGVGSSLGGIIGTGVSGYKTDREILSRKGIYLKNIGLTSEMDDRAFRKYVLNQR